MTLFYLISLTAGILLIAVWSYIMHRAMQLTSTSYFAISFLGLIICMFISLLGFLGLLGIPVLG